MAIASDRRTAFRCAISPEDAKALITLGGKRVPIRLIDTSRDGYTAEVPKKVFKSLKEGKQTKLFHNDETWLVEISGKYEESVEGYQVGFLRVADLTPPQKQLPEGLSDRTKPINPPKLDPTLPAALMIFLIVAVFCLPGIGDQIGTAPIVEESIYEIYKKLFGRS